MATNKDAEHSRRILDYWTAERLQGAQPEEDPEFDMSVENSQAVLDYWTPERIAAAKPETSPYETSDGEGDAEFNYAETLGEDVDAGVAAGVTGAGSLRIVPDSTVKTFPYQSVGKIYYKKQDDDFHATAWVYNSKSLLHVVMTAAHCLKDKNATASRIVFIPGFIPPNKPFGSYPQVPGGEGVAWAVNPNWNPQDPQARYEDGLIRLDKDPNTGKYVDEVVISIQTVVNQSYSSSSSWNTIGYPIASSQNPNGKMVERSGTFYQMGADGGSVYKYGDVPNGTSGGPWILAGSNYLANGIHAGKVTFPNDECSVSRYFDSSMSAALEERFTIKNP